MTRAEAEKELAEIEPLEREAWGRIESRRIAADFQYKAWQLEHNKLCEKWNTMFERVQKLKAFLEIAT